MFKDKYTSEIEEIKADGYIKQKVLNKITAKKKTPAYKIFYRSLAAVAACAVIAMSVHVVLKYNKPVIEYYEPKSAATYDDVYEVVKKLKAEMIITNATNAITDIGEDIIMYSAKGSDNAAAPESDTGAVTITTQGATEDSADFSKTNNQVEDVDESGVIKTDGKYIYSLSQNSGKLRIIKAGKEPEVVSNIAVAGNITGSMYLYENLLVIINCDYYNGSETIALIYDVSKPESPEKVYECKQSGSYNTSRLIGDKLYLISNYGVNLNNLEKDEPETYVPYTECDGKKDIAPADCITISSVRNAPEYTVISGFDITDGSLVGTQSMLGGTYTLYCSTDNIITAGYTADYNNVVTPVTRYSINDGKIELEATGEIKGTLLNQFSIDEYKGNFRFVTTYTESEESQEGNVSSHRMVNKNALLVLNGELKQIGAINDIAPDERVYSVRFMGDTAYFVTFRQVDPLFSVDLSDPENPKIIGALKIPGFSNYLFPYGEGKLLGIGQEADENTGRTQGMKLSMFDISNPSNVTESDKLILDSDYSPALYDHKASLVDFEKNIIGFSVYAERGLEYRIFKLTDDGFNVIQKINLGNVSDNARGMYIGDEFYIVSDTKLLVYNLADYSLIKELKL